jgi:hypothetical protein
MVEIEEWSLFHKEPVLILHIHLFTLFRTPTKVIFKQLLLVILEAQVTYCVHTISLQRYVTYHNLIYWYLYHLLLAEFSQILSLI